MTSQRKVWELQHTTICKVVGMALDLDDLKKIGRKFRLVFQEPCDDEEFVLHSAIVSMCGKDCRISRYVQKLVEKRFARYGLRLARRDGGEIAALVFGGAETGGVPLWAILWYFATTGLSDGARGETALFGRLHMLEHQLLKDYWNRTAEERDAQESRHREEINNLKRQLLTLQSVNARVEKANLRLTTRLSKTDDAPESSPSARTTNQRNGNHIQDQKIRRLKALLEESRRKNRELSEECERTHTQIEALTRELVSPQIANATPCEESTADACSCPLKRCLRGKRIAVVGGIDSLEAHYRSLVEQSGGEFCRHDGRCCRGELRLEDCIRNADLVVCPTSVNSHFGANGVKKVCKKYGISCCFPDSAGLGALRRALVQQFDPGDEASTLCS